MRKMITSTILLSSLLVGCCKMVPPAFPLEIVDSNGINLLPNESTDSTWLIQSNYNENFYPIDIISTENGNSLLIETGGLSSGEDVLIKVNEGDIDTLNVSYKLKGFNCSKKLKIEALSYNGREFDEDRLEVTKY